MNFPGDEGLLDLTREADDTSLGAELLDEIYPGDDDAVTSTARPPRGRPNPADEDTETKATPRRKSFWNFLFG